MGEQAVVANALEVVGEDLKQEAPQDLEDVMALAAFHSIDLCSP